MNFVQETVKIKILIISLKMTNFLVVRHLKPEY